MAGENKGINIGTLLLGLLPAVYTLVYVFSHYDVPAFVLLGLAALVYIVSVVLIVALNKRVNPAQLRDDSSQSNQVPVKSLIVIIIASVSSLIYLSQSSPLYPINDWVDPNIFFTTGRAILNGQVLYQDITDHKGPFMFFIQIPGILISEHSFVGIFLLEVVACFVFLFFIYKILMLFTKSSFITNAAIFIVPFYLFSTWTFFRGGSAEEYILPVYAATLYIGLRGIREGRLPRGLEAFVVGILAGFVFWLKYTMCGLFLGFVLFVIIRCIKARDYKLLGKLAGLFICGYMVVSLPVVIYSAANNALPSLFTGYFYNNLNVYMSLMNEGVKADPLPIRFIFSFIYCYANTYPILFALFFIGITYFAINKKNDIVLFILLSHATSVISIYIGGYQMWYYALILYSFSAIGLIPLSIIGNRLLNKNNAKKILIAVMAILCILMPVRAFFESASVYLLFKSKEELPQYRFAEIINSSEDRTLINYNALDGGFYFTTGTLPFIKRYSMNAGEYYYRTEQEQVIANRETEFIITRGENPEFEGYTIIEEMSNSPVNIGSAPTEEIFYLYQRNASN